MMNNNLGFGSFGFKFNSILNIGDNVIPVQMRNLLREAGYKVSKVGEKTFLKVNPKEIQYKSLPEPVKTQAKLLKEIVSVAQTINGFVVWFGTFDDASGIFYTKKLDKAIELAQDWQDKRGAKPQFMFIIDGRRAGHGSDWDAKLEIHEASQPEEEENESEEEQEEEILSPEWLCIGGEANA
jgi:hypothetical protein